MIPQLAGLLKPKDIKAETSFDVILKAWLEHKIENLSKDLTDMLDRWKQVNAMLRNGYIVTVGKNDITRPYKYNEVAAYIVEYYHVSYRTAYDDIANAKRFFLPVQTKDEKEFGRGVLIEWCERLMLESASLGDYKSASSFAKLIAEMKGLLRDDIDAPAYDQVLLPHLAIVDDPSELSDAFVKVENPDQLVAEILARRKKTKLDRLIADSEIIQEESDDASS